MSNSDQFASWNNFHNHHEDIIRASLRVTNGALNDVTLNTNGVLIDLTAPVATYLMDGAVPGSDIEFQVGDKVGYIVLFRLFYVLLTNYEKQIKKH